MFNKARFGVPQFYPRDLKKRVDEYVVGQDRAKKTICSVIFNHYQSLRRRYHFEDTDRILREKLVRQRFARDRDTHERKVDPHPVEGQPPPRSDPTSRQHTDSLYDEDEFPGHYESVEGFTQRYSDMVDSFYVPDAPDAPQHVTIDKSNLLLIGPTGVGKTYILELVTMQS